MQKVGELASRALFVASPDWTVGQCSKEMEAQDLRHLPVLDPDGRPVAMITDIRVNGLVRRDLADVPADRVADRWPAQVHEDAPVVDALRILALGGLDAVFVVDDGGRLTGIFTEHDAMKLAVDTLNPGLCVSDLTGIYIRAITVPLDTQSYIGRAVMLENGVRHLLVVDAEERLSGVISLRDLAGREAATVDARLHSPVYTVQPETTLSRVVRLMVSHAIGCLPVVGPDRTPVGVITRSDVVRVLLEQLSEG